MVIPDVIINGGPRALLWYKEHGQGFEALGMEVASLDILFVFEPSSPVYVKMCSSGITDHTRLLAITILDGAHPHARSTQLRDVCYCKYSDGVTQTYRKASGSWGNLGSFIPRPMCTKACPCPFLVDGAHPTTAQGGPTLRKPGNRFRQQALYSMPSALCDPIAAAVSS